MWQRFSSGRAFVYPILLLVVPLSKFRELRIVRTVPQVSVVAVLAISVRMASKILKWAVAFSHFVFVFFRNFFKVGSRHKNTKALRGRHSSVLARLLESCFFLCSRDMLVHISRRV